MEVLFNMNDRLTLGGKMSGFIMKEGGGGCRGLEYLSPAICWWYYYIYGVELENVKALMHILLCFEVVMGEGWISGRVDKF